MPYRNKNPVDQGYSWVLLTACFVSYLITYGLLKSFGMLYSELVDVYQSNAATTSTIGIGSGFTLSLICPIAINLCTHYSFRGTMFAAGITTGLGFFLSFFVTRIEFLFVTYSFICGVGFAFSIGSSVTVVNFYFDKRRGLANGILVSASGIGNLIFPHLYAFLFSAYGLRGAFMIIGGVALQECIGAMLVRQPVLDDDSKHVDESKATTSDQDQTHSPYNCKNIVKSCFKFLKNCFVLDWHLFKGISFLINTLAFVSTGFGYTSNFYMLAAHIEDIGYTTKDAALAMSIVGISEVIGRILVGMFIDLKIIAPKYIYIIFMVISGTAQVCVPLFHSYQWLCTYAGIVGVFPGSFFTLLPLLLMDVVGKQRFPASYGLASVCMSGFFVIAQPVLGWLKDYTGSWNASWFVAGTFMLLSASLVTLDGCLRRKHEQHRESSGKSTPKCKPPSSDDDILMNDTNLVRTTQSNDSLSHSEEEASMLGMPAEHLRK